ncbi:MAG: BolA/IbaG family iron-sulfur metabolism protein [Boseongicola sp.]|nr:MAG: BolA/IbaG family iron-sulfur metabolism protein [Boseongicola sp.]
MSISDEMRARLLAEFAPSGLEILDESEAHRGHAGFQEGGESHWKITMNSARFGGMSRLQRHRAVHAALGDDILGRIHALALHLSE